MSFRTLFAASAAGLVVLVTAILLVVTFVSGRRTAYDLLERQASLGVHAVEQGVRARLAPAEGLVNGIAAGATLLPGGERVAQERNAEMLAVALRAVPEVDALLVWRGGALPEGGAFLEPGGGVRWLVAGDEYFRPMTATDLPVRGDFTWGGPVVREGRAYLFAARRLPRLSGPVYVAALVSLRHLSEDVERIGRRYGVGAFILRGEDGVIAHPRLVGEDEGALSVDDLADPVLDHLADAMPAAFAERAPDFRALRVVSGGQVNLVVLRDMPGFGSEPWRLGIFADAGDVREPLEPLIRIGLAGLAAAALGILGAALLGRLVAQPVRRLARSAEAIGRLDFGHVELPAGSPVREVDEQIRAFRLMLDGLGVYATYVPRQLSRRLLALGDTGIVSETRELTVMFTDIRGFSGISDRMGADDTAAFLNRHFELLESCLVDTGGTIDKYIGDSIMAFWGAPEPAADHAARAVAAARRMRERLSEDNARRARKGMRPVRLRIGLHSGPVVVGNIGAPDRVNYTIVGPTVNVAERLQELGASLDDGKDVTVLMSEATARAAGVEAGELEPMGTHALRGLAEPVAVARLK